MLIKIYISFIIFDFVWKINGAIMLYVLILFVCLFCVVTVVGERLCETFKICFSFTIKLILSDVSVINYRAHRKKHREVIALII